MSAYRKVLKERIEKANYVKSLLYKGSKLNFSKIDIYSEEFWKKGLNQINDLLNEAENLYEELYNE